MLPVSHDGNFVLVQLTELPSERDLEVGGLARQACGRLLGLVPDPLLVEGGLRVAEDALALVPEPGLDDGVISSAREVARRLSVSQNRARWLVAMVRPSAKRKGLDNMRYASGHQVP